MRRFAFVALVAFLSLVPTGASARSRVVYLAPVGSVTHLSLLSLGAHLERRQHVAVQVLPTALLPPAALNRARHQYVGEKLEEALSRRFPTQARSGTLIGVTEADMYLRSESWRFAFSIRGDHTAVVAVARMDPRFYGLEPDSALLLERAEKMVTKNVGILTFGLGVSGNPRSVLFTPGGLDDLDYMTLDFTPKPLSRAKQRWLAGANAACSRASSRESALGRPTTQEELVRVLQDDVPIAQELYDRLHALPADAQDAAAVRRMLRRFTAWLARYRQAVDKLAARWDPGVFKQLLRDAELYGNELTSDALRLGSRPCGQYFRS